MKLFKVDLAVYYDPNVIKKILKIIKEKNNNIDLIQKELLEQKIFKSSRDDFFSRSKATYLREFGVYDSDITEIGHLFLNGEITSSELSLLFLIKHCNKDFEHLIRPFEILIKISRMLKNAYGYTNISCGEFCTILDEITNNSDDRIQNAFNQIRANRENHTTYNVSNNISRYFAQWRFVLQESGIQTDKNSSYIVINLDLDIINYVMDYYKNNEPTMDDYYRLNDSFVKSIRVPTKNDNQQIEIQNNRKEYEKYYPSILYHYLFLGNSLREIENDVVCLDRAQNGDLSKKILNGLNISCDDRIETSNKGLYKSLINYPFLVVAKLKYSQDIFNENIAHLLYQYLMRGDSKVKESIITKIKTKYEELMSSSEYQSELRKKEETIQKFQSIFDLEHLRKMTLEEYDFPKSISEEKYNQSFMYFVERSPVGIKLSVQRNKLFYYDKSISTEDEIQYNTKIWIKDLYPNLSISEIFEIYRDELYQFVSNFSEENYPNNLVFLNGQNVLKNQLIRFYYPKTIFGLVKDEIYDMVFDALDISISDNLDSVQKGLKLKQELIKQDVRFSEMDMEVLTDAVYKVWMDSNAEKVEKTIETSTPVDVNDIMSNIFQNDDLINDILEVLIEKKNIILTGTPGVGKTFTTYDIIKLMEIKTKKRYDVKDLESRIKITQFHQNYGYEEFVEGMTLNNNTLESKTGIFKSLVDDAVNDLDNNYYIVIDEINRGNISKIFGELLMCIESDKRKPKYSVSLMYSDSANSTSFYVPENVYIIGTMNTADRSLAPIDYALRRRFSFFPLKPAFHNDKFIQYLSNCKVKAEILDTMNHINTVLYKHFDSDRFDIGHSYFLGSKEIDEPKLRRILKYEIIPLLQEYLNDLTEIEFITILKNVNPNLNCKTFLDLLNDMELKNEG